MIGIRQTSHCTQFQNTAMIDDKGSTPLCEIVYQLAVNLHELIRISGRSTTSPHGFCIPSQRKWPRSFTSHIISVGAHQFNLLIYSKSHCNGCFKSTRQSAGHHQIKRTQVLPYSSARESRLFDSNDHQAESVWSGGESQEFSWF